MINARAFFLTLTIAAMARSPVLAEDRQALVGALILGDLYAFRTCQTGTWQLCVRARVRAGQKDEQVVQMHTPDREFEGDNRHILLNQLNGTNVIRNVQVGEDVEIWILQDDDEKDCCTSHASDQIYFKIKAREPAGSYEVNRLCGGLSLGFVDHVQHFALNWHLKIDRSVQADSQGSDSGPSAAPPQQVSPQQVPSCTAPRCPQGPPRRGHTGRLRRRCCQ